MVVKTATSKLVHVVEKSNLIATKMKTVGENKERNE